MRKVSLVISLTSLVMLSSVSAEQNEKGEKEVAKNVTSTTASTPASEVPLTQTPEPPQLIEESTTKRRQVTYDQRQEGQYNIRADLENFMIVVIPPNPVAGVNLLDLLTRSSLKRSSSKKANKKSHSASKFSRPIKAEQPNVGYLSRTYMQQQHPMDSTPAQYAEYIEGRTPYRVDISSENDFTRIHPDPQVDVLPPPYPLHLHLMKPYHLEAEPTVVQSPTVIQPTQGKLLEFFNRIGGRVSKSIKDHPEDIKELRTNHVVLIGEGRKSEHKRKIDDEYYEIPNTELSDDQFPSTLFDSINPNDYNEYKTRTAGFDDAIEGNWELKLIGATEQCGPDRRRDSYGICQFVSDLI